jgi:hypothetical protein
MKPIRYFLRRKILILLFLAVGIFVQVLQPAIVWSQQNDLVTSLLTFNRAAINGDIDTVEQLLSRRFLRSTSFVEQKRSNPGQLREEVQLLSFYQTLDHERLTSSAGRVKVVKQRLVGRQGLVTRWFYLVKEGSLWKVDRIGDEEPYQ